MHNFIWVIGASLAVSLVSLIGIFSLMIKEKWLHKILILLIGFSAGGLIGGAFLHLLPEALELSSAETVFLSLIVGFIAFFILEKYLHWRHCHEDACQVHTFTYLNLVGDSIHNFIDGLVIGSSFLVSVHFGVVTTLVILFHEIPQEMGDFAVLVYGGFNKFKALYFNFLTALTCVAGAILGYFISERAADFSAALLPFAAGGFIYIAACDLIPELHKETQINKSLQSILMFISGILFIFFARMINPH